MKIFINRCAQTALNDEIYTDLLMNEYIHHIIEIINGPITLYLVLETKYSSPIYEQLRTHIQTLFQ